MCPYILHDSHIFEQADAIGIQLKNSFELYTYIEVYNI